jgi:hypothetical protein
LFIDGIQRPNLEIIVEPVEGQSPDKITFTWQPISFNNTHLTLKLDFKFPIEVSIRLEPNILKIFLWNSSFFVREKDGNAISPKIVLEKKLPQMVDEKIAELLVEIAQNISDVSKGVTATFLVL